ncbi:MAG: hypothetical protein HY225_01995 [Candidatus Vogelbacteria bacterium]|nr:hypothetical protein [Candidatus Vogelbacteria bacterium]
MKIPESIITKLDNLERKKKDRRNRDRLAKEEEKTAVDALKRLKKDRAIELQSAASSVAAWIGLFYQNPIGKRLLKAVGSLKIFCAAYWLGMPVPEAYTTTFAVISLDAKGNVSYGERYKGMPVHETFLDMNPVNPAVLVEALHPDYLVALADHLVSGVVWEYIENFLPKEIY